jgi:DNA-binding transcriptional MerR regulator
MDKLIDLGLNINEKEELKIMPENFKVQARKLELVTRRIFEKLTELENTVTRLEERMDRIIALEEETILVGLATGINGATKAKL